MANTVAKLSIDHSIVEASAIRRTLGETKPAKPAATATSLPSVETAYDVLKAAAERLMADLALLKHEIQADREETRKDRDHFRDFLRTQRRRLENHALVESHPAKALPSFQCGSLVEAEAVLAAQQRLQSSSSNRIPKI